MNEGPVRVAVISQDPLARAGLAALLAGIESLHLAHLGAPKEEAAAELEAARAEVIVWDLGWDPAAALEVATALAAAGSPLLALVPDAAAAEAAWASGAAGVLPRQSTPAQLAAAVEALAAGLTVAAAELPLPARREPGAAEPPAEELTPRELEVLRLVAEGLPNKTIAARLGVSEHTVKFHMNAVLRKLGAASRTEAVVRGTRLGLILL